MSRPATLGPIVQALGGDLYAGGRRANVPGPGHGNKDRSVSLLLSEGRLVIHCFAGDDWREVRDDLVARGLIERDGRVCGGSPESVHTVPGPGRAARLAAARALWAEARPIAGTLSERHLRLRRVPTPPQGLRHHPGVPAAVYAGVGRRRPALLAGIEAADGALVGVEVTYLAPNGERARVALPRKTVGCCPAGAVVRLFPPARALAVGEGVFTTLSAAQAFGRPAWALLSTRNLRCWRAPEGVRDVLIAADRGRDGAASARILAAALRRRGVRTQVRWPPAPFGDWNEAAGGGPGGGGKAWPDGRGGRVVRAAGPEPDTMTSDTHFDPGLVLLPEAERAQLLANGRRDADHVPVVKLFNPAGPGTWLLTELDGDGDTAFGLCDLDMGCPELGSVSLAEITSVKLPFGLSIERDIAFSGRVPISRWAEIARRAGSIREAEAAVRLLPAGPGEADDPS